MADDEYGRVPAGWYPDPLGLPQLRWWDNHAWTEHVSDARQPMMPTQPGAATMFADDELPSRRSLRSTESAPVADESTIPQPTAEVLRELAPPSTTAPAATTPADAFAAAAFADLATSAASASTQGTATPWVPLQSGSAPVGSAPVGSAPAGSAPAGSAPAGSAQAYSPAYGSPPYSSAPGYGSAPGYSSAPGAPAWTPTWQESPVSASDPGRRGTHQVVGTTSVNLQTIEAWALALLPMLQLLLSLLVIAAFSTGPSVALMAAIWLGPLPFVIVVALLDARSLRRRGVDRPTTGWLAVLGAPVYLTVRAVRLSRISGSGFGPVGVTLLLMGLIGASILAVPGLIIAALPATFADQASTSVELNARSIGAGMDVSCPETPPLFIGQQLRCPAVTAGGDNIVVTVSLQRSNGWIAWQIDDWGIFSVVR